MFNFYLNSFSAQRKVRRNEPEHVWHDEEAYVRSADVHLVEMGHATVARCHSDIFELDVHVVFGCKSGRRS